MTNPLLEDWTGPFQLPPFDRIEDSHFAEAIDAGLAEARANIAAIANNPEAPDFANTIEALETTSPTLDRVLGVFFNLEGSDSNDARQALQKTYAPQLAAFSSEISMNPDLFRRIDALWSTRDTLDLTQEQARLLMLTRRGFLRSGAALEQREQERLAAVMQRLATLSTTFTQNLLADEKDWSMTLGPDQTGGLPDSLLQAARAAAGERGEEGYVITTSRSLVVPFLQYSTDRSLRQLAFEAWTRRGANGGKTDNRAIAAEILALRQERAELLGFENFAHFKLETEMARTPDNVRDLLMTVWEPALKAAERDAETLEAMLRADGGDGPLEPWDWRYYSEVRRKAEHDLDEAELKPYFQLDNMMRGAFSCANRLYGLEFAPLDVPLYHADARAFDVTRGGEHVAVFIADYFARPSKRSGAWCSAMRSQERLSGDIRPIVVNVCNFSKPVAGHPALLSFDDAETLFHEFGHALHQMLSNVTYGSISGTSVARDFVELPSQVFEHWLSVPAVLQSFATHAETGESLPEDLQTRLLNARSYDTGFATVEFIASAMVDLDFHDGTAPKDPMQRQAQTLEGLGMPRAIAMRHATPHFAHVFAGDGYSSGYYSYMWSEVMDADAFQAFEETGDPFDPETAKRFETHVLSAGGSDDPAELYKKFRGRMPGIEALLENRGLA